MNECLFGFVWLNYFYFEYKLNFFLDGKKFSWIFGVEKFEIGDFCFSILFYLRKFWMQIYGGIIVKEECVLFSYVLVYEEVVGDMI